jgi:hypothetical protein
MLHDYIRFALAPQSFRTILCTLQALAIAATLRDVLPDCSLDRRQHNAAINIGGAFILGGVMIAHWPADRLVLPSLI